MPEYYVYVYLLLIHCFNPTKYAISIIWYLCFRDGIFGRLETEFSVVAWTSVLINITPVLFA